MNLAFHFIIRFVPKPEFAAQFRDLMLETAVQSRRERACLRLEMFEDLRTPGEFSLHSVWTSEEDFEVHAGLPHTARFVELGEPMLTHEFKGLRLKQIGEL